MMKLAGTLALCAVSAAPALAEEFKPVFVGNEAVTVSATGQRNVELPPKMMDVTRLWPMQKPNDATDMFMIEAEHGLLECSVKAVDMRVCRPSTLGRVKTFRTWVVKVHGAWQLCGKAFPASKATHGIYLCDTSGAVSASFLLNRDKE